MGVALTLNGAVPVFVGSGLSFQESERARKRDSNMKSEKEAAMPPWGQQTAGDVEAIQSDFGVPEHWKIGQGLGGAALRNSWDEFIASTLKLLSACLWPAYDIQERDWPAQTEALRISTTRADLALLAEMQSESPTLINKPVRSPVGGPVPQSHLRHFEFEDASRLGRSHADYDATLSADRMAEVPIFIGEGIGKKSASTAKQLKRFLQRPRPYQMAYLQGVTNYHYLFAESAHSPSMISGHGIAGMIGVGTVIDKWLQANRTISTGSMQALQQYAVDIGDRRVFAGVHYPADNLSSWIVTMILGKEVFENKNTVRYLAEAITERSEVYRRIQLHQGDAYKAALKELHKLMA